MRISHQANFPQCPAAKLLVNWQTVFVLLHLQRALQRCTTKTFYLQHTKRKYFLCKAAYTSQRAEQLSCVPCCEKKWTVVLPCTAPAASMMSTNPSPASCIPVAPDIDCVKIVNCEKWKLTPQSNLSIRSHNVSHLLWSFHFQRNWIVYLKLVLINELMHHHGIAETWPHCTWHSSL